MLLEVVDGGVGLGGLWNIDLFLVHVVVVEHVVLVVLVGVNDKHLIDGVGQLGKLIMLLGGEGDFDVLGSVIESTLGVFSQPDVFGDVEQGGSFFWVQTQHGSNQVLDALFDWRLVDDVGQTSVQVWKTSSDQSVENQTNGPDIDLHGINIRLCGTDIWLRKKLWSCKFAAGGLIMLDHDAGDVASGLSKTVLFGSASETQVGDHHIGVVCWAERQSVCVQVSVGESTLVHIIDGGDQRQEDLSDFVLVGLEPSRLETCGLDESAQ